MDDARRCAVEGDASAFAGLIPIVFLHRTDVIPFQIHCGIENVYRSAEKMDE